MEEDRNFACSSCQCCSKNILKLPKKCNQRRKNLYSTKDCSYSKVNGAFQSKNSNLKFNISFITCLLIFLVFYAHILSSTNAYVMEQSGLQHSYLHHRLAGRQRREVQRKFLDLLGLPHRPKFKPNTIRKLRHHSAPLYMLGLYHTVSGFAGPFDEDALRSPMKRDSGFQRNGNPDPETNSYAENPDLWMAEPAWVRHSEALRVFTNEVGVLEYSPNGGSMPEEELDEATAYDSVESNNIEKTFLGEADLVMSFMPSNNEEFEDLYNSEIRRRLKRLRSFRFEVSETDDNNEMISSKFRIYKEVSDLHLSNETFRISVYQAILTDTGINMVLLGSRRIVGNQEGWLVYDVTNACKTWMDDSTRNLGLHVTVETLSGRNVNLNKVGIVASKKDGTKQAFMVSFFKQVTPDLSVQLRKRRKRNAAALGAPDFDEEDELLDEEMMDDEEDDDDLELDSLEEEQYDEEEMDDFDGEEEFTRERDLKRKKRRSRGKKNRGKKRLKGKGKLTKTNPLDDETECHRKFLRVYFKDVGWEDWIIAPEAYDAYYCSGNCPFPLKPHMNATNHAIIKTLMNYMDPNKGPKSCCSPTKLEAISVLYYDDNKKVIFKKYKDMRVTACGCA